MIIHFVITLVYFLLIAKLRENRLRALCETSLVFFIPGFGLLFMIIMNFVKEPTEDPSYVYKGFSDDRMLLREFSVQESDILPVQDALMLEDNSTKRNLLLDVIKRDVLKNDELLLRATHDEDTEISHYAVSIVTTKIQTMEDTFYEMEKRLADDPDDLGALKKYADTLSAYLKIGFLDNISTLKREREYVDLLARILALDKTEKKYFLGKIDYEIHLLNFTAALEYCDLFHDAFIDHEEPYLQYVKLYHKLKDSQKIREYISRLKATNIKFSKETLDIIRFWDESKTA